MTKANTQMEMLAAVGRFERQHDAAEVVILLNKFGVTRAIDVSPDHYNKMIAACSAKAPRPPGPKKTKGRKPNAFETVINSAPTLKEGFDLAARAIHARPAKT